MAIEIVGPDGSINTFPDGTSDNVIKSAMGKLYPPQKKEAVPIAPEPPTTAYEDYTSVVTPPKEQKEEGGFYSLLNKISKDTDKRLAENADKSPFLKEMLEGRQARQNVIDEQRAMELQQPPSSLIKEETATKPVTTQLPEPIPSISEIRDKTKNNANILKASDQQIADAYYQLYTKKHGNVISRDDFNKKFFSTGEPEPDGREPTAIEKGAQAAFEGSNELQRQAKEAGFPLNIFYKLAAGQAAAAGAQALGGESTARVAGKVAADIAKLPPTVLELISPDNQVSKALFDVIENIEPETTSDEAIVADLLGYIPVVGGFAKLGTKAVEKLAQKVGTARATRIATQINRENALAGRAATARPRTTFAAPAAAKFVGAGATGTVGASLLDTAHQLSDPDNLPLSTDIYQFGKGEWEKDDPRVAFLEKTFGITYKEGKNNLPETLIKAAELNAVDPENADARDYFKANVIDNLAISGIVNPAIKLGKLGIAGAKAAAPTIAKINTGLGRAIRNDVALPAEIRDAIRARENAASAYEIELKRQTKDLTTIKEKYNISDDDFNAYLSNGVDRGLPQEVKSRIDNVRNIIQGNQDNINIELGLNPNTGIGAQYKDGNIYLTRTFEAVDNPKYLEEIKKALTGSPKADPNFQQKVNDARNYLRGIFTSNPTSPSSVKFLSLSPSEQNDMINYTIENMVKNLSGENKGIVRSIFEEGRVGTVNAVGQEFVKVLKARKKLDPTMLELFGEVKDPIRKAAITLQNQNRLMADIQYIRDIEDFATQNAGREINLKGLFPLLPNQKTLFTNKPFIGAQDLSELPKQFIGRYGDSGNLLKDMFTTPEMAQYLSNGSSLFTPTGKLGNTLFANIGKLTRYGQATQTSLDPISFITNTYGAAQSLAMNGHLLNWRTLPNSIKAARTLAEQVIAKEPNAVKYLENLKREGVIDSSLTGEVIKRNVDLYGTGPKAFIDKAVSGTFKKAGDIYGSPDNYFKILAHQNEMANLSKIFPNKSQDEIFKMASQRVRDTMPTYGEASAAVRELSKLPIGTYALFPSEVIRTTKNIVGYSLGDILEGTKTGNIRQVWNGLSRLSSAAAVAGGIDLYARSNNETLGVTPETNRALDMLAPDWGKGSIRIFSEGLKENKDGQIKTRFSTSNQWDAMDSLKAPLRLLVGKVISGKEVTDIEREQALKGIASEVAGPYVNPKFVTSALISIVSGTDQKTGKPVYDTAAGNTVEDKIKAAAKQLAQTLEPGLSQDVFKYIDAMKSEQVRGEGEGVNAAGFPLSTKDLEIWKNSGVKTSTVNLDKAIGFDLSKNIKDIKKIDDLFKQYVGEIKDQPYTPKLEKEILDKYNELMQRKFLATKDFSDKMRIYQGITYFDKNDKPKNFDFSRIYKAVTDKGWYPAENDLFYAQSSVDGTKNGVFMPTFEDGTKEIKKLILDKKFPPEIIKKLDMEARKYAGRPLNQKAGTNPVKTKSGE